jgi:hypothetical protein
MSSAVVPEFASPRGSSPTVRFSAERVVIVIAAIKLVFQLATATRYGYYGDELYYYACSRHMQWGYYDHPPFVAAMMWLSRHLFGSSLLSTRIVPSLCGAFLVWLAADLSRKMGGGWLARVLTAVCVACAPVYMLFFHLFSMNAFECVLWTALVWVALHAIQTNPRYWILFGVLVGLGMENKYSAGVFVIGLAIGLLLTPARNALLSMYFWIGLLLAVLIFLPNLMWLSNHGWPFLQWQSALRQRHEFLDISVPRYLWQQILITGGTAIFWIAGLLALLFSRRAPNLRFAGVAALLSVATFYFAGGRVLYPAPLFAILFAAGAVSLESWLVERKLLAIALAAIVVVTGAVLAPCFVPILPIQRVAGYEYALHLGLPIEIEKGRANSTMPFQFAWETGWDNLVRTIAQVYNSLPPEERAQTGILTFNYHTAGAIDLLGPKYGLPPAIGTHMTYHMWGPRQYNGEVLIVISDTFPPRWCRRYEHVASVDNPYTYTNAGLNGPIVNVCYGLIFDLQKQWEGLPWY